MSFCIPAGGFVDVKLATHGEVSLQDGRLVGLHLDRVSTTTAPGCGVN
jgi:hypothetical protein